MSAGDKSKYTKRDNQQFKHIEDTYEARGYSEKEAERKARTTLDTMHRGSPKLDGSGYDTEDSDEPVLRGGKRSDVHRDSSNRDEIVPE